MRHLSDKAICTGNECYTISPSSLPQSPQQPLKINNANLNNCITYLIAELAKISSNYNSMQKQH